MNTTTFHFSSAQELTLDIIKKIKANFKSKPIKITIEEEIDPIEEMDTTEYLMSNPANKKFILESIEQFKRGEVIKIKYEDL